MRLHWKRKDERICTLGGKPHQPRWTEIKPEHSPGFLGGRSLGPLSVPWEQSPSSTQSPEPHHCPLISTPTGHSLSKQNNFRYGFSKSSHWFPFKDQLFLSKICQSSNNGSQGGGGGNRAVWHKTHFEMCLQLSGWNQLCLPLLSIGPST